MTGFSFFKTTTIYRGSAYLNTLRTTPTITDLKIYANPNNFLSRKKLTTQVLTIASLLFVSILNFQIICLIRPLLRYAKVMLKYV